MIILSIEKGADREAVLNKLLTRGYVKEWGSIPLLLGYAGSDDELDWVKTIPGVHSAELDNQIHQTTVLPVTPGWTTDEGQWNILLHGQKPGSRSFNSVQSLLRKGFRARFNYEPTNDGTGVNVYVVDAGLPFSHPDWGGRTVTRLYDSFSTQGPGPHGTWVASCALGTNLGVAPGANIFDAKCFPEASGATTSFVNLVNGMDACLTHFNGQSNPGVMNCSFGGWAITDAYDTVITACVNAGLVVVASAGNDGKDLAAFDANGHFWPAENPNSFTVGGLDAGMRLAQESNYGGQTDFYAAYANWTLGNVSGGTDKFRIRGTSFSGPMVAGMMARILQGTAKMTTKSQVDAFKAQFSIDYGVTDVRFRDGTPYVNQRRLWIPDVVFNGWESWPEPQYSLGNPVPIEIDHARTYVIVGGNINTLSIDHARTYVIVDTEA